MKNRAKSSVVPPGSAIHARLPGAYFFDCHAVAVPHTSRSALDLFLSALKNSPAWVNSLMALRNKLVKFVGLKDLGGLGEFDPAKPESAYLPGDRVGIFTLISNTPDEALLGESDKHLDVVLSVYKHSTVPDGEQSVAVTTVVHVHNLLGRVYMLPVTPLHRIIAPAVLSHIASGGNPATQTTGAD
ncbi:MAG: DUF2867 domain-containing protein [Sulfuricella sp.]|nr:DUF2867 domain-containing protein [Sulfuricella sp.]